LHILTELERPSEIQTHTILLFDASLYSTKYETTLEYFLTTDFSILLFSGNC